MKKYLAVAFVSIGALCASCVTVSDSEGKASGPIITASSKMAQKTIALSDFSTLKLDSWVDVEYLPSSSCSAEISAPDNLISYVKVAANGATLRVSFNYKGGVRMKNQKVKVTVYGKEVSDFILTSSGDLTIPSPVRTDGNIKLTTQSAGDIKASDIQCALLTLTSSSSGDINVKTAQCRELDANVQSAGDINVNDVTASVVSATTSSAGDIILAGVCHIANLTSSSAGDIKASGLEADGVTATATSAGDIFCTGRDIESKSTSAGDIHATRL